MRHVVIIAGGQGTRLWPLSRRGTPKQLLPLLGDRSLLRIAYDRLRGVVPPERILVCTGADHADRVRAELPELPADNLLGEPQGRDSLNAVAWPAAVLQARDPQAVVATVTADHLIEPVAEFAAALDRAFIAAETRPRALVTLGVVPTSAHTGLGYLHRGAEIMPGAYQVRDFTEKPDRATAEAYLARGEHWWNSGMFVWRAAVLLEQLRLLMPQAYEIVTRIAAEPDRLDELFPALPRISVDYAVMEPVSRGAGTAEVIAIALPIRWQDVGSYQQWVEHLATDDQGNAVEGLVVQVDATDTVVINRAAQGHLIATIGLQDTIVVGTDEVTLICPRQESARIKELVAAVLAQAGPQYG